MKPVYSRRALADLYQISSYYALNASPAVAQSVGQRLLEAVDLISLAPRAAPVLSQRSGIRTVPAVSYPFRIFYRIRAGAVEVVHMRHTSRRPIEAP